MIYNTIRHDIRNRVGLSMLDYCLLESIYLLSNNDKAKYQGWCNAAKSNFEYLASDRTIVTRFNALESDGWLEFKDESRFLKRTTLKYFNEVYAYVLGVKKLHGEETSPMQFLHPHHEETAYLGVKKLHPPHEETAPNNTIDNTNENNKEKECVKKEPTHPQNEDFNILKDLILKLSLKVESLESEKEKEKSSAKKEKEEVVGDTPPPTPPHQTDLNQAKNIPMWKFEILENKLWESTPEKVQKAFWSYCEMRQELESRGITTTAVLQNLKKVELFLKSNTADIVISCLELAIEAQNKTFDPMFVTNRKNGAFKSTKEKPLHNNDLVMKSESLNHLNKWNKAK